MEHEKKTANDGLTGVCALHATVTAHTDRSILTITEEIKGIRNELRAGIDKVHVDVKSLAGLLTAVNTLEVNQQHTGDEVDKVWKDVKEIKSVVAEALTEKEIVTRESRSDRLKLRKDVDSAHDNIRELQKKVEAENQATRDFIAEIRSGTRMAIIAAGAIPSICLFIFWLITKLYHI